MPHFPVMDGPWAAYVDVTQPQKSVVKFMPVLDLREVNAAVAKRLYEAGAAHAPAPGNH